MGISNIKTTKSTYNLNLNFSNPETARAFAEVFVAGNEAKIVEGAEKLLSANSATLQVLPMSTAAEIANASLVASAGAASGVEGKIVMEKIQIGETVTLKLSSEK